MSNVITSKNSWELLLSSIAGAWDGADTFILGTFDEMENYGYKVKVTNSRTDNNIAEHITQIKVSIPDSSEKISSMKAEFVLDEKVVQTGDVIVVEIFNSVESAQVKLLEGKAKITNRDISKIYNSTYTIEVVDEFDKLFEKIVTKDTFLFNKYIYAEQYKENSILYIIAKSLGFTDDQLNFEDVRDSQSRLIQVPFMLLRKDNRYIDELQTILEVTKGRIYVDSYKNIVFKNGLFDYEKAVAYQFDTRNILRNIGEGYKYTDKNGIRVLYDSYKYLENQVIFDLANRVEVKTGTNSENQKMEFNIKFITDLAVQHNITKAEGYYYVDEEQIRVPLQEGVHYELVEFKETSAKVKFFNPYSSLFFIDKFEIKGIPLVQFQDNEVAVKETKNMEEREENFSSYTKNKYIQTEELASDIARVEYIKNCKNKKEYSFKSNFVPHLEPGDVCSFKLDDIDSLIEISSIEHTLSRSNGCYSEITALEYEKIEQEFNYSKIESLTAKDSFLGTLNNIKDQIDETDKKLDEVILIEGARGYVDENDPRDSGKPVAEPDVWFNPVTKEFKVWRNGKWNPAREEDIPPALMTALKAQAGVFRIGGNDVEAGIFFQYDKDTNNPVFGSTDSENLAQVSIDKRANILIRNANNKLAFNMRDPENPSKIVSQFIMGVYNADDKEKHKDTLFQVGDESTGTYIKFTRGNVGTITYDGKEVKEHINLVKKDADEALEALDKISDDGWLTVSEKTIVEKEWEEIKQEFSKIRDRATTYKVDSTVYSNSKTALDSYLLPMLNTDNFFKDTEINRVEFNSKFKNYYDARTNIFINIEERVKSSAVEDSKDYADTVIDALGKDLENQIDGKINTYNQEADPSLNWSATDKTKNTGDLWYKPSEKVTRRWTGSAWQVLDAKDTVAQALAQSKRRVFTAQPTVPYDAGDLWITNLSSTGDMMICVTSRTTGSYTASEWKKATKYTDDTKANEALSNANKAQVSANGVQSQVDEMASDDKLSPIEKQQTKKEWEIILAEYPQNIAKANAYEVLTTTYTNAYNTLKSYIEPLLSNLTTASDIVGTTFRANFKNYYDAEIKLTGNIYDKVKESAITNDNANRIINSELRDLNLWTHSMTGISHSGEDSRPEAGGSNGFLTLTNTTGAERYLYSPRFQLEAGTYTISLGLHGDSLGTTADLFILGSTTALSTDHSNKGYTTVVASNTPTISNSWKRVTFTFTAPSGLKSAVLRIDNNGGSGTRVVHVNTIKLEKGSVATPWTKCPLDNKYYADAKVENYASDGVLTPSEKTDLKSEIETIEGSSTTLKSRATLFEVSVTTLTNYVTTLTNWKTTLSQAGNYTDAIQIAKLRTDFKNYYIEEEKVYDGIEKKAKALADKAQTDANGALGLLTDIASDNKFTPSEKQSVKKEWDIIVSEYAKNIAEAKVYGVDYTSHTTTYNALNTYITPLLSNLTTTSDIVGTTFRTNFKNYYDSRTDLLTKISAKTLEIGFMQNGKMLYLDPTFKNGLNSINRYDNSGSGLISISRVTGSTYGKTPPNDSNMVALIEKATGTTSPNMGGFFFGTTTRAGMRVLTKIIAHIPVGYKINWASNATGTGGKNYWATLQEGTGEFKEYIHVLECGTTGTFSSTAFFHISSNDGNNTKPIKWGICYATVFDAYSNQSDWVNDALQNANNAQISANGVQSQVDEMSSDNKLSPIEKQQTKKEWEIILSEYPQNIAKANAYGVSTTTYTNSYNALNSYITPLLSSLTTTSDITGTTFRTNFKNYYDAEIKLTGDIYDKVKASAVADSKTYADGIDSKLTGYMSDGVLTPQEKGDLRYEIMTIENRATSVKSRASVFGVATTTLTNYVAALTNWKNGVLSQSGIYNNLTQVNVLRVDFRNYYTEEEKVYDGIDKKAKALADKAQTDANGALGLLTDIASDNKLTASEKQSTKKEWDVIVSEYTKNVDQAKIYGVSYTDYTNKYNALNSYITPLLSSLTTTSDITGTTFRTNFKNYYDSRTALLNAISAAIKALADNAQNTGDLALDNQNNGHVTINANTTFTGDANFVSKGSNETTIVKDGSITFTRAGVPVTVIRNMRSGSINTNSQGNGVVRFSNMSSNLTVLPSIQSFSISQNIRSLHCRAEIVNAVTNDWRFIIGGTESSTSGNNETTTSKTITKNCVSIGISKIDIKASVMSISDRYYCTTYGTREYDMVLNVEITYADGLGSSSVIHSADYKVGVTVIKDEHRDELCTGDKYVDTYRIRTTFSTVSAVINKTFSTFNKTNKTLTIKLTQKKWLVRTSSYQHCGSAVQAGTWSQLNGHNFDITSTDLNYSTETTATLVGEGVVSYIALEN